MSLIPGVIAGAARRRDPLSAISGLSFWDHREGVFTDAAATNPAANTDPVGAWVDRLTGYNLSQATAGLRPTREAGFIALDNDNDGLVFSRTRTPQFTLIFKIKLTAINEQRRFGDLNYTRWGINSGYIMLLNEAVTWSGQTVTLPTLNQAYVMRITRSSATQVDMWIDGVLAGSITGAQAADASAALVLAAGSYAGIALADRVLTAGEIAAVEAELATL